MAEITFGNVCLRRFSDGVSAGAMGTSRPSASSPFAPLTDLPPTRSAPSALTPTASDATVAPMILLLTLPAVRLGDPIPDSRFTLFGWEDGVAVVVVVTAVGLLDTPNVPKLTPLWTSTICAGAPAAVVKSIPALAGCVAMGSCLTKLLAGSFASCFVLDGGGRAVACCRAATIARCCC